MKPTAAQILQRCKDIVEGKHSQPEFFDVFRIRDEGYAFYVKGTYVLVHSMYISTLYSSYNFPALLLGMDSEPAPEIVLEWEDVKYPTCAKSTTKFNDLVSCTVEDLGECVRAYVLVSGVGRTCMDPPAITVEDAQKWCADTIKAIVTPNPKQ